MTERRRQKLSWAQRIAAATGVAKGIQFLHTGIVPGIFANNIKITDVLLDQNLVTKISSYNLPLLSDNMEKVYINKLVTYHDSLILVQIECQIFSTLQDSLQNFFRGSKELKKARLVSNYVASSHKNY